MKSKKVVYFETMSAEISRDEELKIAKRMITEGVKSLPKEESELVRDLTAEFVNSDKGLGREFEIHELMRAVRVCARGGQLTSDQIRHLANPLLRTTRQGNNLLRDQVIGFNNTVNFLITVVDSFQRPPDVQTPDDLRIKLLRLVEAIWAR